MNTLPAGLIDNNVEFFINEDKVLALQSGVVKDAENISIEARQIIMADMMENKPAVNKLSSWGFKGEELIYKYVSCRCGGFDNVPDIDLKNKKLNAEYWNCPNRAKCDGSGLVCILPHSLSHRQLDVIKSLETGEPMKNAAQKVGLKYETYKAYMKSIYKKLDVHSNTELLKIARASSII